MKKKFIICILVFVIVLGGLGVFNFVKKYQENKALEETLTNYSTPLLYKVTKEGGEKPIYLFGSIHLANDDAYPLPNEVMASYNASDYLAVEFDLLSFNSDFDAQIDMVQKMLLSDGKTIKNVMTEETYNLLINYLEENNSYTNVYEYYGPAFFYSLVSNIAYGKSKLSSIHGIDMYFLKLATNEKKEIIEMESSTYQTETLLSFSNKLYDLLIKYSIKYEEELIEETKLLYDAWLKGDEKTLSKLLTEEIDKKLINELVDYEESLKLIEEYEYRLITERNNEMTEKTEQYLKEDKNVFVVVGLAHIIGEDGIISQLKERGYKVEKININKTKLREEK